MNSNLFSPTVIGGKKLTNRFVAQAMEINAADKNGKVSQKVKNRYQQLAKGEWGLVFSEAVAISENALARKNGLIINDENLNGFKDLVCLFKIINSESLFLFQLTHSGRNNFDESRKIKIYEDGDSTIPVVSERELDKICDEFIEASILAYEAGADGIDIKACHGYLGAELLRPANKRNDKYGGTVENRAYFFTSIIKKVKKRYPEFIVGTRISFYEGIRGGCGTEASDSIIEDYKDLLELLEILVNSGIDYINVSAGIPALTPMLTRPNKANSFILYNHIKYTKIVKEKFPNVAIIGSAYTTGMEYAVLIAEESIEKNYADLIGMGRQNLADALTPKKIKENRKNIHWCKLCGGCSILLKNQEEVYCKIYMNENIILNKEGE